MPLNAKSRIQPVWESGFFPAGLILFGLFLRLHQYLANRSLWLDEAQLAFNILSRGYLGLTQKLDLEQGAPIGFLWVTRFLTERLGGSEYVLRLFPMLCGLLALPLFYGVAGRLLGRGGALFATALFVFSDQLVYFSSELKQYMVDVALVIGLLGFIPRENQPWMPPAKRWLFGLLGLIAISLSHPSVFVLAGLGACFFFGEWKIHPLRALARWVPVFGLWVLFFGGLYFLSYRHLSSDAYLLDYWKASTVPFPPLSLADCEWYFLAPFEFFRSPFGLWLPGIGFFAALVGGYTVVREKDTRFYPILWILGFSILGSGLGHFPILGRVALFLVPLAILLIAKGVAALWARRREIQAFPVIALGVLLLFHSLSDCLQRVRKPRMREEIRPVLQWVLEHRRKGDSIYSFSGANVQISYYAPRLGLAASDYVPGRDFRHDRQGYSRDVARFENDERVWVLFSHDVIAGESDYIRLLFGKSHALTDSVVAPGAAGYLFSKKL